MIQSIAPLRLAGASLVIVCATVPAHAALVDRGGGLIYDTDLDVTWLQDANYAKTSGYDADGRMAWDQAVTWAANLTYYDSVRGVTYDDWRLPTTTDLGTPGCNYANGGTDCGFNVDPASSEMAHLYFVELGNLSYLTTTGAVRGYAGGANPYSMLDNTGPFINFVSDIYWSGTENALSSGYAWAFWMVSGQQGSNVYKPSNYYVLAVRPGDVAAVPEADTYTMMAVGLGLLSFVGRRKRKSEAKVVSVQS